MIKRFVVPSVSIALNLISASVLAGPPTGQATFQGLGDLPGGMFYSIATATSADGSVVVGMTLGPDDHWHAFRWIANDGLQSLGHLPGPATYSEAAGISADGTVIVGTSDFGTAADGRMPYRWTAQTGMTPLTLLPGGDKNQYRYGYALATSADGSISVGSSDVRFIDLGEAFIATRWTSPVAPAAMAATPDGAWFTDAWDVSADGLVVVGDGSPIGPDYGHACIWTAQNGPQFFQWVPGQYTYFGGVSADGQVAIATGDDPSGTPVVRQALRWTQAGGFQPLGALPGCTESRANGISGDGSVVVGVSQWPRSAFIWTAKNGIRDIKSILTSKYGLDVTGWQLEEARAVSDDGLTIVGFGRNPGGQFEAWVATLPCQEVSTFAGQCAPSDTDGDGLLDDWEINGIPYTDSKNAEQRYLLDLDKDGKSDANPNHKDMFVEVDVMSGLLFSELSKLLVQIAFEDSPMTNPDGVTGVALHTLIDDTDMPFAEVFQWNNQVGWPSEFDAYKTEYFGTIDERNHRDAAAMLAAKAKAFRYCMGINKLSLGLGGYAEVPGNDFMVCLGLGMHSNNNAIENVAATFMHELGHTLGLSHGGLLDGTNGKPNYVSIMNYLLSKRAPWNDGFWKLDYSRAELPTLNEDALDETQGIASGGMYDDVEMPFGIDEGVDPPDVFRTVAWARLDGSPVDFGTFICIPDFLIQDGIITNAVCQDLNYHGPQFPISGANLGQSLTSTNDWAVIDLAINESDDLHGVNRGRIVDEYTQEMYDALLLMPLPPSACPYDTNGDRVINIDDLLEIINHWGDCGSAVGPCPADVEPIIGDRTVNIDDLLALINRWNAVCP